MTASREHIRIVIVGHVDHGKSTVIGRLLADTNSLPKGKLAQVKAMCERNSKPFEYAFLLDALKDEQSQGITIDTARCFFKTKKRDYIVLDAPGHIEFLKNMVTGAARAEAALLVIDADEGIKENSRRHGYLMSMLGIKQVTVVVNKMDLVKYDQKVFDDIRREYTEFLVKINVKPVSFIPISARLGENLATQSDKMPWYPGKSVLEQLDAFEKQQEVDSLPFRFPVQDIYKFTLQQDDRRIVAGTVETGSISVGESVTFYPSGKEVKIKSIEAFNVPKKKKAHAGESIGFTLSEEIYIRPGELMVRSSDPRPLTSSRFKANIFWMGKVPLIKGKTYKLKLASSRVSVTLVDILSVLDASDLTASTAKQQIERHDVAECVFETAKPIAFDPVSLIESTGRFVIVDNYEIAGGGIIIESLLSGMSLSNKAVQEHKGPSNYLPLFLDITKKKILIVGGGKVALHKIKGLLPFTQAITVIGLNINADIPKEGIACIQAEYDSQQLLGFDIVYACTDNRELNQTIRDDAHELNLLVNVADDPDLSDFISPAVYRAGDMTVAVSSGGKDVKKAIAWRDRLREFFERD